MNEKLEALLGKWEERIFSTSGGYEEFTKEMLPLLEERILSFEEVFIIWALSKRNSKLELKARFVLLADSAQDELELEIARRIESNDSRDEGQDLRVQNWIREVVIKEVPNLFVSIVMEKGQTYLL